MGDHRLNAKETFYLNVYRLLRMDAKGSRARVAFALLSALAICCSVMYITADGDAETVLAARGFSPRANKFIGSGYDIRRSRRTREIMRKNKRAAARSLKIAVLNQQRAL